MVTFAAVAFSRQIQAVAFFGNSVGQQHDVLVSRLRRQHALEGFGQRRRDLRAAVRADARDQPLDQRAIFGAAQR